MQALTRSTALPCFNKPAYRSEAEALRQRPWLRDAATIARRSHCRKYHLTLINQPQ